MFDVYCEAKGYNQDERKKDLYLKGLLEARHRVISKEENEFNLLKRAYEQGSFDAQRGLDLVFKIGMIVFNIVKILIVGMVITAKKV